MKTQLFLWLFRFLAAGIMLQTLYFKFTGHPESVYIFSSLGIEPWGRVVSGIVELLASILLLVPATTFAGALLAIAVMTGAVVAHVFILGIEVLDDGGQLFVYACIVMISSFILLVAYRAQLASLLDKIYGVNKS